MLKIALIAPGFISIPPVGWGAIETLVYDYSLELERQGFEVLIVNNNAPSFVIEKINEFQPDIVHCHADNLINCLPAITCEVKAFTSHFGYLEKPHNFPRYLEETHKPLLKQDDIYIFSLSPAIAAMYLQDGVPFSRIRITPNGVNTALFDFKADPSSGDKGIFLAQISSRKRQYLAQRSNSRIDFVGGVKSYKEAYKAGFNPTDKNYLGEWSRGDIYKKLTEYGNLVLLSDAEAHPLVCLEGLSAGLGLVVSQASAANLDTELPFITVIPEEKIQDRKYVKSEILENRKKSIKYRNEIRAYAQEFDYRTIVGRYIDILHEIINNQNSGKYILNKNNMNPKTTSSIGKKRIRRFMPGITSRIIVNYWHLKMKTRNFFWGTRK